MSTRRKDTIEGILWIVAMAGMLGLLIAMKELRGLTKEATNFRTITNRK